MTEPRPSLHGIHHIKIYTGDFLAALTFYTDVLGLKHLAQLDHHRPAPSHALYGVILQHPSLPTLELREDILRAQAAQNANANLLTFRVASQEELEQWAAWFDKKGVRCSGIIQAMFGYTLAFDCPDGLKGRFYVEVEGMKVIREPSEEEKAWLD